jgi:putative MFS transporter
MASGARTLSIEKALDAAGFGPFQMKLFVLCGLGWSADVGEIRLIGFLLDGHTLEFELTPSEKWVLSAIFFLGMFLGAWLWGIVADRCGRKHAFTATCALTFSFGAGSALSGSAAALAVCRFGVGLGLGGNLAVDFSMFLEYLPSEYRGRATVWLTGWSAIGNIWASGLAWAVIPDYGWRPYVVLCAAPLLPAMILRLRVKESPRYLLISGLPAEAAEVIVDIARGNGRLDQLPRASEAGGAGFTLEVAADADAVRASRGSWRLLCSPAILRSLIPLCVIWFCVSAGFYGQSINLPSFLRQKNLSEEEGYLGVLLAVCAEIPGVILGGYLVDRIGRIMTLRLAMLGCCCMLLLFSQVTTVRGVTAVTVAFEFCSSMVWGAAYLYTPEVLPTPIRAVGLGACSAVTRVAGMLSPGLGQMLSGRDMLGESIVLYALIYAVGGLVTCTLPVETSGQNLSDGTLMSSSERGGGGGGGETSHLFSAVDAMGSDDEEAADAAASSSGSGGGVSRGGKKGYAPVGAEP